MADWIDISTKMIIVIFGLLFIYMVILKLTGHSPTSDAVLGSALTMLGAAVFNLHYKFGQFEGKIETKIDNLTEQLRDRIKKS